MRFANTLGKRHTKKQQQKKNYQSDRKIYNC